jgi:hypothetical protein
MPKRLTRPWDNGIEYHKERLESIMAVPSVEVQGVVYKSDRFYLHSLEDETPELPTCSCGSKEAPPLFPREAFLKSLDLKAAIFGTYTLNLDWMARTVPHLVGPSSSVPTLILHGQKGLMKRLIEATAKESLPVDNSEEQGNSEPSTATCPGPGRLDFRLPPVFSPTPNDDDASSIDGGGSLRTQEDCMTSPAAFSKANSTFNRSPLQTYTPEQTFGPPRAALFPHPPMMQEHKPRITLSNLGSSCHLTQIRSAWKPTIDTKISREDGSDDDTRESKRGVHHPKCMLLFET